MKTDQRDYAVITMKMGKLLQKGLIPEGWKMANMFIIMKTELFTKKEYLKKQKKQDFG